LKAVFIRIVRLKNAEVVFDCVTKGNMSNVMDQSTETRQNRNFGNPLTIHIGVLSRPFTKHVKNVSWAESMQQNCVQEVLGGSQRSERMRETIMSGSWIHEMRRTELSDSAETLHRGAI